jgi:ribose 5-phosphate isomerase A
MGDDNEKQLAARASVGLVRDGDIVGLGTGSTAIHMVPLLAERIQAGLKIKAIPTSARTRELAASLKIPLTSFDEFKQLDITIDGADEVDPELRLIKGGGGALLREKIVASASKKLVIIVDSTKQVQQLGKFPLPVEVIAFAQPLVTNRIAALGASVKLRRDGQGNPFLTDEGHHLLDCNFGSIDDPSTLARKLDEMTGVVEHGLFIGMADMALIAKRDQVIELRREKK